MVAIFTGTGSGLDRGSGGVLGAAGLLGSASLGRGDEKLLLNAATGNLVLNRKDEFLVGRGPDLGISRTYNSLGNFTDENGDNWRQSTDRKIFDYVAYSSVKRRAADGSEAVYHWNGGAYVSKDGAGSYDTLSYNGNWTWTDGDSRVTETYTAYGADWRIASQSDTSGNSVTFSYSGANLVQVATADGGTVQYEWSGNNISRIVTSSHGRTLARTYYTYDGYNRLSSVVTDLSPEDFTLSGSATYTTNYSYHGASKLVAGISQTDGSSVSFGYDGANRVTSITQVIASGVSRTTTIAYGGGYTVVTDPAGQATVLYYDGNGQLTQITAPPAFSGAGQQTVQFAYNGNGDITSITDSTGRSQTFGYDGAGNQVSATDRVGNTVYRTYNAANQLVTESRVGSNQDTSAAWHTTRYVYDGASRLRYIVSAEGNVTENFYDGYGQLWMMSEYTGQSYDVSGLATNTPLEEWQLNNWRSSLADPTAISHVQLVYDGRGGLSQRISYGGAHGVANASTAPGYKHEYFTYDQSGQLLSKTTAGLNAETYAYDGLGRVTSAVDLNGGTTSFAFYDASTQTVVTLANGLVETSTYNKAGELISKTESGSYVAGGTATYAYDQNGRLRMSTDASGIKTYFLYDRLGRRIADVNEYGWVTEYRYDANDRLVATANYANGVAGGASTMAALANPLSNVEMASIRPSAHAHDIWSWTVYDHEGQAIQKIGGDGSVTAYEYDASGRLVRSTDYANKLAGWQLDAFRANGPSAWLPAAHANDAVARVFYDKDGRAIGALDGEGYLTKVFYDAGGRKVQEIAYANATYAPYRASGSFQALINSTGWAGNGNDRVTRFVYDSQDQLRFTIDALNQVTEYTYEYTGWDSIGLPRTETRFAGAIGALSSYTYASVKGAVAGLAGNAANRTIRNVYDAAGRVAYTLAANGSVTGYSYNNVGQVTRKVEFADLNGWGHLPSQGEMDGWASGAMGNGANRITRNYYTARGELRFTVDAEGYVTRNDYDAAGRLTASYRWDAAVSAADWWTIGTVDANVGGTWIGNYRHYDAAGNLTLTVDGEGTARRFYYHANGTLAWDIVMEGHADEARTLYYYDGAGRVTQRYDAVGTAEQTLTQFAYDGFGNLVSTTDPNGRTGTRAYDKLGRVVSETNPAGGTASYQYNSFGEVVRATDERGNSTYSYYDKLGRIFLIRDAENYVTEHGYTVFGELSAVTRRFSPAHNVASVDAYPAYSGHGSDATTTFAYDKLGRLTSTTDATGHTEYRWYDAVGNLTQVQNKIGGITQYTYDRRGLLRYEYVHTPVYDSFGNVSASAYYKNIFEYDSRGNVAHRIEAYGLAERRDTYFVYDKANRLTRQYHDVTWISQADHASVYTSAANTSYTYDKRGNLIEAIDPNGARSLFYYDDLNRKIAEISPAGTLSTYQYDAGGNLTLRRVWGTQIGLPGAAGGTPPGAPGGEVRETSYAYDNLNRLISSSIQNVRTGVWNGSSFALAYGAVTTTYDYDAMGNLLRTVDGAGNATYWTYDRLGRKTRQVDAEGYVTGWLYDAGGNVFHERRWAQRSPGYGVGWIADPAVSGEDRVTEFSYDRMGQRLSEHRYNVQAYATNGAGQLYGVSSTATVSYAYNGLGQVTRKTEATGDYVDYSYDGSGRLTMEQRAPYVDHAGAGVRPTVRYYYDGLDNLSRTSQGGNAWEEAGDRVTRYVYGAGGRLSATINPAGEQTDYYYDLGGNLVRQSYNRKRSNGSYVYDGMLYTRDAMGRVTSQTTASWHGYWAKGDVRDIAYNAFGEVSQRGLNGGWQEQFAYDNMGQLYRTNSGDGVWRYFVHDGAGNRTAAIESEGSWIAGHSIDGAISTATYGFAYGLGAVYIDGINVTLNVFDRRGQATQSIQAKRQLSEAGGVADLVTQRGYNAFGETAWEIDARGAQTNYGYNSMGRMTSAQRPWVLTTNEYGGTSWIQPVDYFYYDISGRLIGTDNANGRRTTRTLLAGSGYGGTEALVSWEWHADGGVKKHAYDRFGDLRQVTSETGQNSYKYYDAMGRLTQVTRPSGHADYYDYDVLGQQLRHWTSWYGTGVAETTDYDSQGRVTAQTGFGGETTTTSYGWSGGIYSGLGVYGGWVETTTYHNGRTMTEYSDLFGHTTYTVDLGGHGTSFSYDYAARMVQSAGAETTTYSYLNTGLVSSIARGVDTSASQTPFTREVVSYGYDANGNRLGETMTRSTGQMVDYGWWEYYDYGYGYYDQYWVSNWQWETSSATIQSQSASYDALNRITSWSAAATATTPAASTSWSYDNVGNVRRVQSSFAYLDQNGNVAGSSAQDLWYRYDGMNRVVTAKGQLINGQIQRGTGGTDYSYFADGRRATATTTTTAWATVWDPYAYDPYYYDPYGYGGYGYGAYVSVPYSADRMESYGYDADGNLTAVSSAESGYYDNGDGTITVTPPGYAALKAQYWYDGLGRMTRQLDYLYDGNYNGTVAYDRQVSYNASGQSLSETIFQRQGSDTIASYVNNYYGYGADYALGGLVSSSTSVYKNGSYQYYASTSNSYAWYAGAVQSSVSYAQSGQSTKTSYYYYTPSGVLSSVYVADGRPRSISFTTDLSGQVIRRDEYDNVYNQGDPHEVWYRFGGKQMGYIGNDGTIDIDYQASINARTATQGNGAFRNGATWGSFHADFEQSGMEAINSFQQGSSGGSYTIRAGDTLASIARAVWGDSSLWYKLAEANGLSGASALIEGQALRLPAGVQRSTFNASTLAPYDPAEAIGDTSPTTPTPQAPSKAKKNKCGVFGQIISVVIAVVVTIVLTPVVGPVGAALLGNVASQGFGIATGMQDKFSWKSLALTAVTAGVGQGLDKLGLAVDVGNKVANAAINGAMANAISQGIGVATGLQSKFDFAGVAVAGIVAGVGQAVSDALPGHAQTLLDGSTNPATHGNQFVSGMASGIAGAAARSLITGTSFGDNLLAVLPDVIGSTIGRMVGEGIVGGGRMSAAEVAEYERGYALSEMSFAAGSQDTPPTRAELEARHGVAKAAQIMRIFNEATGTIFDSRGRLALDPRLKAYLDANPVSAAEVVAEETRLLGLARTGDLRAFYDFGYTTDPATRFDTSMTSIGDDRRAATLALQHHGISPTETNIDLITRRVFGNDSSVKFPREQRSLFNRARRDLGRFVGHRSKFISGLARSSLAINRMTAFADQTAGFAVFRQSLGDMRAAIDQGYFTLRPYMSVSPNNFSVGMQQYNAGGRSEIIIYREGFAYGNSAFRQGILHELMHSQSAQERLYPLEVGGGGMRGTTYDPDPKTYYDRENGRLVVAVNAPPSSGPTPSVPTPTPSTPSTPGGVTGNVVADYEKGNLMEGNVNNWWSRQILRPLRMW